MSRRFMLALLVGAACLLLPPAHNFGTNAAAPLEKTSATVKVNCAKGESVNKALTQFETARSLTVEISGLCVENVLVTRDRVTLRGCDPATDGIEAEVNDDRADVAVWVRGAQLVTLERLKLTGGFSGLLATNVTLANLRLVNCRLEGNNAYGAQLQNSLVEAEDTTFAANGNTNAGVFAQRNFDVWGYSQRVQGLTAGTCESNSVDCSPMANWGLQTIVDDVAFVRQQIEAAHPGDKPVVGGLSLGSIASLAVINSAPDDYAGAMLIEGTIYDEDPAVRAINANFCSVFEDQLANGVFYDGQGTPGFKLLSQLAEVDPDSPTPFPGFPPGFTNHRAWVAAMAAPPLSPTTPRPGYVFLAGSVAEDRFFFADEALVHASITQFVDYVATRTVRDLSCGLAGETTFTDNLHSFDGPVIMFAGGKGFGTGMTDTAGLLTSASVTMNFREEYGHVDHVFSFNHLQEVEHPVLAWLQHEVW